MTTPVSRTIYVLYRQVIGSHVELVAASSDVRLLQARAQSDYDESCARNKTPPTAPLTWGRWPLAPHTWGRWPRDVEDLSVACNEVDYFIERIECVEV